MGLWPAAEAVNSALPITNRVLKVLNVACNSILQTIAI